MTHPDYLSSIRKQFLYYKMLGDKTLARVPETSLTWQYNPESNSIAVIVKHLWGNMLSRWTDFLTSDGEKPWREREAEFDNDLLTRERVLAHWEAGWACLFNAIDSLTPDDLTRVIYIRNEGHSVLEALNRQLAHYPYHVGQIVMLGKMILDAEWESLSIPRGGTQAYNEAKFTQPRHKAHFTDTLLRETPEDQG
ncbi:MAG: DUF1572 domain-containing protein [Bacteroidia bacterium]|nr:DUF1572 domain-containing protein [Bacteroidia bacterium]